MSNGTAPPFGVTVTCSGGNTAVNVSKLKVPLAGTGAVVTITWTAQGNNTFPTSDFFSWKQGSAKPGNATAQRTSDKQLTLTYNAPPGAVTYSYNIKLDGCTQLDPDIDNEVPPGDEDDDRQGGGGGGKKQN
jgi:hypothetical protein